MDTAYTSEENHWTVVSRLGYARRGIPLEWYWEVHLDWLSDDYAPAEISPYDLFKLWDREIENRNAISNGLVKVDWYVAGPSFLEAAPAFGRYGRESTSRYDVFFHPPVATSDGSSIDWSRLPVVDKLWNEDRCDKGGFLQEVTGWKPSVLQPYVAIDLLRRCAEVRRELHVGTM